MTRPLRTTDPSKIHLVTCRTEGAALWMVPGEVLNGIIGGVLARYQRMCNIILYAYVVLGNHYHLLAKAPDSNLAEFAEQINREIARRVNWHVGRRGHFWGRRYDDQVVIEDTDALEAFLYIVTNPVRHGLVRFSAQWPGLSCYEQLMSGVAPEYKFTKYSEYHQAKRTRKATTKELFTESNKLTLAPLPQFAKLSQAERAAMLEQLISEREKVIQAERATQGKGFLGLKGVLRQAPGSRPLEVSNSPRLCCYTKSAEARRDYRIEERIRREMYEIASFEFRLGHYAVEFPQFCFKPPLHKAPRILPFVSMAA